MKSVFLEVTFSKIFFGQVWENPGKRQNSFRAPKNLPAPAPMLRARVTAAHWWGQWCEPSPLAS